MSKKDKKDIDEHSLIVHYGHITKQRGHKMLQKQGFQPDNIEIGNNGFIVLTAKVDNAIVKGSVKMIDDNTASDYISFEIGDVEIEGDTFDGVCVCYCGQAYDLNGIAEVWIEEATAFLNDDNAEGRAWNAHCQGLIAPQKISVQALSANGGR